MRHLFQLIFLTAILAVAGLAVAQSAPFRVKPSDIDSTVKDPSKEIRETHTPGPAQRPRSSATSKDLESLERQTAKLNSSPGTKKTSGSFKPEKDTTSPKINVKGSGEPKAAPQTRVATSSYKGRLKQKGAHSNSY